MSDLVLYTNPQSRGRIAHWMLEEIGQRVPPISAGCFSPRDRSNSR